MEVKLLLDGDITVVSLKGRIDIEKNQAFKRSCLENFKAKKVVFFMKDVSFVGSTGIQSFFGVLSDLHQSKNLDVRVAGLNADFRKLVFFNETSQLEIHENIEGALQSF